MKKLDLTHILWLIAIGTFTSCDPKEAEDSRPNIIYIMVDDMGYADLSSYGQRDYQTPVMDDLVSQGIKFTNAYAAAPVCSPTRVALMTGQYPARNVIGLKEPLRVNDDSLGLSPQLSTLSSMIKEAGYETALFGKWHLGETPEFLPARHGFDHFWGITFGHADYIDHKPFNDRHILYKNEEPITAEGYLTDLITDNTIDFIKGSHDKPFFISLQYTAPHWPWQLPGDDPYPFGESVDVFLEGGSPEIYAGMMRNLDTNIGRILKELKNQNLSESTVIIFTSDNGGVEFSNMSPLQGRKGRLWEGGIKVPACVVWPDKIQPGQVSTLPVVTMDWTVTMLDLAKSKIPEDLEFDGMSLIPVFSDVQFNTERTLYWRTSNYRLHDALRKGNWKYLKTGNDEFLFDLEKDPGEANNMKDDYPIKFEELKNEFEQLDNEMLERLIING